MTALIGGALADAHDRRPLVLVADTAMLVLALVLVANALLAEPQVWVLLVVASGMTAAGGLQRPALDSMVPRLVPREELPAAAALEAFRVNAGQIAGPAVGGLLIAGPGLTATYAVDAATFLVSLVALARGCRPGDPSRPRRRGERRHRRAIVGFGLAGPLPLALALLAIAGAADMSSGIFRSTMWNQTIPDSLRGRLAGIEQLSYSIGPTLGTTQSGTVASIACAPRPSAAACCAWRGRSCCAR